VAPPPEARAALDRWIRPYDVPGRLVPPENWHITLRFIGSADQVAYERLLGQLSESDPGAPFIIRLGGLGAFPNPRRATVAWMSLLDGGDRLAGLSEVAEEACQAAGLAPEERPFRAHLTVSRIRPARDVAAMVAASRDSGIAWRCDHFTVYQSHQGEGHPRYEPLDTFALGR
jgi:2'-5' RNA ligase